MQELPPTTRLEAFTRDGKPKGDLEVIGSITATVELETNYYVFCMSHRYDVRFYTEFNADTCLVIADPDRFINQACKAIAKRLPGWAIDAGAVRYRSPTEFFSLKPLNQHIYYNKDSDQHWQTEVRIVCSPPRREYTHRLEQLFVNIGNLHESLIWCRQRCPTG